MFGHEMYNQERYVIIGRSEGDILHFSSFNLDAGSLKCFRRTALIETNLSG